MKENKKIGFCGVWLLNVDIVVLFLWLLEFFHETGVQLIFDVLHLLHERIQMYTLKVAS